MKINISRIGVIFSLVVSFLGAMVNGAQAADGTWTKDAPGTQAWSTALNWLSSVIADGQDSTANFTNALGAARNINFDANRTIGNLTFGTNSYTITNFTKVLTLSTSSGTPTISVTNGYSAVINTVLGGNQGVAKNGGGGINLGGTNTWTGTLTVNAGTLRANVNKAFNDQTITETADNTTVYHNAAGTYAGNYNIIGYGVSEGDPADTHLGAIRMATANITLSGTITLLGDAGITSRGSAQTGDTISGLITGNFGIRFNKTTTSTNGSSGGTIFLSNTGNNWTGDTTVADGTLKLGAAGVIPNGSGFGNVIFTNPGAAFNGSGNGVSNTVFDLNGFNETINGLSHAVAVPDLTKLVVTNSGGSAVTLTVGDGNASGNYGGLIQNGANALALFKMGSGTETLSGANGYNGNTTISGGTLALSGSGSIANSPNIVIAGGATFNVSGLSSTFGLGGSQTLSNSTSTAVLNGNANSGSGTVSLTYASGTPSITVTNGTLTLSSSTTIKVNNTGSALAIGSYKIVSAANSGNTGSVAGTAPSTVTVGGGGIAAGTLVSLQITGGELFVVVSGATTPHFSSISVSGTTLSLSATNGAAGATWTLLQSTNIALPLAQWQTNRTGTFDGSGNVSTNIANGANNIQMFYNLKQ